MRVTKVTHETAQQPVYRDGETPGVARLDRISDVASLAVQSRYGGNGHRETKHAPKRFVAPEPNMSDRDVVDYFLSSSADEQPNKIIGLARSISSSLERIDGQISGDDDSVVRGVVLLMKAKSVINEHNDATSHQVLGEIFRAVDPFMKKTEEYVRRRVETLLHSNSMIDIDDLIAYGQIGLLQSIPRFDLGVDDVLVLTYCADRVRGSASDAQRDFGAAIRYSRSDHIEAKWLSRLDNRDIESLGEEDKKRVKKALEAQERLLSRTVVSYDASIESRTGKRVDMRDIIPDQTPNFLEDIIQQQGAEERVVIVSSLIGLVKGKKRNSEIIKMRYGLPPYDDEHTLDEIAQKFGFTESRAQQIVSREIERFHNYLSNGSTSTAMELARPIGQASEPDETGKFHCKEYTLYPAEFGVLELTSLGLSPASAAKERHVTIQTIKSQRKSIIKRLKVVNMQHAIRRAYELGLFQVPEGLDNGDTVVAMLTRRKLQVLEYLSYGYDNPKMAAELHIGIESVKSHAKILHSTIGAKNRYHAIRIGFEKGYLSSNEKLYI